MCSTFKVHFFPSKRVQPTADKSPKEGRAAAASLAA